MRIGAETETWNRTGLMTHPLFSAQTGNKVGKQLGIAADGEIPSAQAAPVIDRHDPAPRSLVFLSILIVFFAFHLQNQGLAAFETDQIIRFIVMLGAFIFIRDQEKGTVVSDITENMIGLLLQI